MYHGSQSSVRTQEDMFTVKTDVKQGCVLFLLLFNIYIDKVSKIVVVLQAEQDA
uniref:Reverse transcriptase domain-containing protein n=1 Tax=Arion vulgaris TaxID=1028688 RepID=A0A0B7B289_9EUPU